MANTLTNLIPSVYRALNVVSRELTGFIPSVTRDAAADRLALNQSLYVPQAPVNSAGGNVSPAMAIPSAADQTIGSTAVTISKSRFMPFSWSGEEQYAVDQGPGFLSIREQQIAQAIRALVNEIETDLGVALALGASRAVGPASSTLFSTNLADVANIRKILVDNGAPPSTQSLVMNTTAGAALRTLGQISKANEAGSQMTLRDGELLNVYGISLKESAQVVSPTVGTGANYLINEAGGYAVGATALTLDTGTGTILAGDLITIGSHTYVVASALAANVVTIAAPGLRAAVANNDAVTVVASSARNVALSQDAAILVTRLPTTTDGDLATMREVVTDPRTGMSFEIVQWPGADMVTYHVRACWGVKVLRPEHIGILRA